MKQEKYKDEGGKSSLHSDESGDRGAAAVHVQAFDVTARCGRASLLLPNDL